MAAGGFLRRWSARKAESGTRGRRADGQGAATPAAPPPAQIPAEQEKLPTMEDVRQLTQDADYSRFMARKIDPAVRRAALKILFSDPHFQRMDGLDVYIGDYTRHEPLTPAMLAALQHARRVMGRADELRVQEQETEAAEKPMSEPAAATADALPNDDITQEQAAASPELDAPAVAPVSIQGNSTP